MSNVGAGMVKNLWGHSGVMMVGGISWSGSDTIWDPVVELWTVNQTTNPLTFTMVEKKTW